jgi:hypothetical protein
MRHLLNCLVLGCCIFVWTGMSQAYTWYSYNGHSYAVIDSAETWAVAEQEAVSQGGHLVTINDTSEQTWLVTQFGGRGSYWIGLYQIPGSKEPDEGWVWISGEPVTFTNWHTDEPNNFNVNEECVAAMNEHAPGHWNDLPAGYTLLGIVEVVPLPSAVLLLGSGLVGLIGLRKFRKS